MVLWPQVQAGSLEAKPKMAGEVRYYRKGESAPLIAQDDLETAGDEIEKSVYEIGQVSTLGAICGVTGLMLAHTHPPTHTHMHTHTHSFAVRSVCGGWSGSSSS